MTPILTSSSKHLAESLFVFPHVTFPSLDCFSRLQDRLCAFRQQQVLHPYSLATFVIAAIRNVQSSPRFKSHVDINVLHCHQSAAFAQQCQGKTQLRIVVLETLFHHCCHHDLVFLHRSPTQWFNPLGICGSHVCCELK